MFVARELLVAVVVVGCGSKGKTPVVEDDPPRTEVGNATAADTVEATALRPELDITLNPERVDLPQLPAFELPKVEPGYHSVRELLVRGSSLRGTEVKVRGFVTWIYSCAEAVAEPGMSKKQVQQKIDDDPTICERPKFYLADTATARPETALWVVDVPRAPNKMEKTHLPKEELAAWPKVPKIALGDRVTVVGTLALRSPHGETNSDGLLVYASLSHDQPGAATETPAPIASSTVQPAPLAPAPAPTRIPRTAHDAAQAHYQECASAIVGGRYAEAADQCTKATVAWPGHHAAWWGLGMAHASDRDWAAAMPAFERAASLDPEAAMYQMWSGIAQYEAARLAARDAQAVREGRHPDEVVPDLSAVNFEPALALLLRAVALEPRLYSAHYYIGRIHRDQDRAHDGAAAFTAAINANPHHGSSFVALARLYLQWGFVAEAIRVAVAGAPTVDGARDRSNLALTLGQAYDDHAEPDRALAAYDAALTAWPDNEPARFQRGQARFRKKDYAAAKVDLEAFAASGPSDHDAMRVTHKMLLEIAAAKR